MPKGKINSVEDLLEKRKHFHSKERRANKTSKQVITAKAKQKDLRRKVAMAKQEVIAVRQILDKRDFAQNQRLKQRVAWDAVEHSWIYVKMLADSPSFFPEHVKKFRNLEYFIFLAWATNFDMFTYKHFVDTFRLQVKKAAKMYGTAYELSDMGLLGSEKIGGTIRYFLSEDGRIIGERVKEYLTKEFMLLAAAPYLVGTRKATKTI